MIPPFYDSLIAKVIVWDENRPAAIERSLRALAELEVRGVPTTAGGGRRDRREQRLPQRRYSTSFLEEVELAARSVAG